MSKKVFVSRILPDKAKECLEEANCRVEVWHLERPMLQSELIQSCLDKNALLCTSADEIDAHFFNQCSHLDIVSTFAVGYDNIDLAAAKNHGVRLGNTPGVLTEATAEIAFALMIAVARKMFATHNKIVEGNWNYFIPKANLGLDLKDKTLGIFGLGAIGYEMARRCQAIYNMDVIYHNRNRNIEAEEKLGASLVSYDNLLKNSDVLSVHANLNQATANKFDASAFSSMKKSAIFINTARGGLHNETDLIQALKEKEIWGAGLDVTNPEPMLSTNPLLVMENAVVLPHIGSSTIETRNAMARLAAENIVKYYQSGQIPHEIK